MRAGTVAGTIVRRLYASTITSKGFTMPLDLPSSPTQLTGSRIMSIEIDYEVKTLALTDSTIYIRKNTRGADGSDYSNLNQTFSYDANHDTAAKRGEVRKHRMTLTPTVQPWIDNDNVYQISMVFTPQITTEFHFIAGFVNYYWRD